MKSIEKVIEIGTKIKTYNDYHSIDEVIQDIDDMFGLLKDVEREYNGLFKKYQKVIELSKENADSYEYTLRDLAKELDVLQEENEQLKNNIELMSKYNSENFDELLKLRKENEELKNKNYTLQCGCNFQIKINEKLNKKLEKLLIYRQALEEIREMLGSQVWAIGDDDTVEEIRNKINEVLNERN